MPGWRRRRLDLLELSRVSVRNARIANAVRARTCHSPYAPESKLQELFHREKTEKEHP